MQERSLPAAALSNERNSSASRHIQGEVLEYLQLWAGRVVEVHALQLYVALHALWLLSLFLIINLGLPEQLPHSSCEAIAILFQILVILQFFF
jgi:hypothetical protein